MLLENEEQRNCVKATSWTQNFYFELNRCVGCTNVNVISRHTCLASLLSSLASRGKNNHFQLFSGKGGSSYGNEYEKYEMKL